MQSTSAPWQDVQDLQILAQLAAQAALSSDWQEAILINKKILGVNENDVEALNRTARAHVCLGELEKAQKIYKKVLELDPYNIIANKNMEKISKSSGNGHKSIVFNYNLSNLFLSEPGKTKVLNLINLAPPNVLALLNYGEQVSLNVKTHAVSITSTDGVYLGALPDDIAHKLITFITGGNKYEAFVKSVSPKSLTIFVREIERSEKFTNQPSFQTNPITFFESEE
ncbi:tetratricopeptide repeat protein [Candidatus Curtissbacteria bacterium]|nr:tetratricopeptide repeat protein [Candidatus Curtissbacteria bacterium]